MTPGSELARVRRGYAVPFFVVALHPPNHTVFGVDLEGVFF